MNWFKTPNFAATIATFVVVAAIILSACGSEEGEGPANPSSAEPGRSSPVVTAPLDGEPSAASSSGLPSPQEAIALCGTLANTSSSPQTADQQRKMAGNSVYIMIASRLDALEWNGRKLTAGEAADLREAANLLLTAGLVDLAAVQKTLKAIEGAVDKLEGSEKQD